MFRLHVLVMGSVFAAGVLATLVPPTSDPRTSDEFLFYDFWSKQPATAVKDHFKGSTIVKSVKAYGVGRYLFLVKNTQSAALKSLKLPNDAENIRVFTVEHLFTFFSHFSVNWHTPTMEPQDDKDLTFLERTWHPRGMTEAEFADALEKQAGSVPPRSKNQIFIPTAGLPVKFLFFMNKNDYNTTELLLKHTAALGGPGNLEIHTLKIFNI